MSYAALILGESGSGKTASLRNFDPAKTLLIQPVRKPLPFPAKGWREICTKGDGGNIFVCNDAAMIVKVMHRAPQEVVIIDDWQYLLSFQYMHSATQKFKQGEVFEFYKKIGYDGFSVAENATLLDKDKRVYILAHTATDEYGHVAIKTLGKMLDDKIVIEGMFTTVLRTKVDAGQYLFSTQTNGNDTVKSPIGMFDSTVVPNDLAEIDARICDFYGIEHQAQKAAPAPAKTTSVKGQKEDPLNTLEPTDFPDF